MFINKIKQNVVDSKYLYVAYATDDSGNGFRLTPDNNSSYIGVYLSPIQLEESQLTAVLFSDVWMRLGADGADGISIFPSLYPNTLLPTSIAYEDLSNTYDNASIDIIVIEGTTDVTSDYTFAVTDPKTATANVSTNTISVTAVPQAWRSDEIIITATRAGYPTITINWTLTKIVQSGAQSVYANPSTINLSVASNGSDLANTFTNKYSEITVLEGEDDVTSDWTFSITSTTFGTVANNSTLNNRIQVTDNEEDSALITVTGTRANYEDIEILIPVIKVFKGDTGTAGTDGTDGANAPDGINLELDGSSNMTTTASKTASGNTGIRLHPTLNTASDLRNMSLHMGRGADSVMDSSARGVISWGSQGIQLNTVNNIVILGNGYTIAPRDLQGGVNYLKYDGGSTDIQIGADAAEKTWYAEITIIGRTITGVSPASQWFRVYKFHANGYSDDLGDNILENSSLIYNNFNTPIGTDVDIPSIETTSASGNWGLRILLPGHDDDEFLYWVGKIDLTIV